MTEDLNHIDKLFRSEIEKHEEMPSSGVWQNIDKALDKRNILHIKRKYANLKRVAFFLALLLAGISIYDLHTRHFNIENGKSIGSKGNKKTIGNEASLPPGNEGKNKPLQLSTDSRKLFDRQNKSMVSDHSDIINPFTTNHPGKSNNTIAMFKGIYSQEEEKINVLQDQNNYPQEMGSPIDALVSLRIRPTETLPPNSINKIATEKNHIQKHNVQSPFSFTFFLSPDLAWYRLQDIDVNGQQDDENEMRKEEHHSMSTTTGILMEYKLNSHWSLVSGLTYSNTLISIDPKTIYAQTDNNGNIKYRYNFSSGYGFVLPRFVNSPNIGDSLYAFTSTHTLQYLGIPIAIKYNVSKGKLNFSTLLGISTNILTEGRIETLLESGTTNESEIINDISGLKSSYFSGLVGVGVEYNLNKKISINFSPTTRFALNSINTKVPVKSYPNSFGFAAGIKINL